MKKIFAFVLIFAMLVLNLPLALMAAHSDVIPASAIQVPKDDSQQIEATGGWNPPAYPTTGELYQGKIAVRKTIAPTEIENYFDISLEVVAKQQYADQSVDIVLVMDISNTMNATHENLTPASEGYKVEDSRLYEAKQAVNTFIDHYASAKEISENRRFSLVTFNSYANVTIPLTNVNSSTANTMKATVNNITAPEDNRVRFTNIEGGLQLAYNIMKTSQARYKYIIFVTDGFPTTYIESGRDSTSQIVGYDTFMINTTTTYDVTKVGTDGYFADSVTGKLALYGTSYSDKAAYRAAAVAEQIKNADINIFSIGIDVGVQSVPGYVDKYASNGFTVVDRSSEYYAIGSTTESYKSWLANTISGGPLLENNKFEEHRYSAGNDQAALLTAFDNILVDIKLAPSYTLRDAYTLDPMSDFVEFLYFHGYDGSAADTLVNDSTGATVATFDKSTETIDWQLIASKFTRVGDSDIFSAVITYRVRVKNEVEGFTPSKALITNDTTTFFFKTVDSDGNAIYGDNSINYPIPEVEAYLGDLEFTKRDAVTEEALTGAEFTLEHYGDSCHYCEGGVDIADFTASTDENGKVLITNIPSGHEYFLVEDVAPEGYTTGTAHSVVVSYGKTYLHTEEITDEHPGVVYNSPITPVTANIFVEKTLTNGYTDRTLSEGEFTFVLTGVGQGGAVFHEKAYNNAEGYAAFRSITFDMPGEYTFSVYEEKGSDSSVIYDNAIYTINYIVTADDPKNPTKYVLETKLNGESVENGSSLVLTFGNSVREPAKVDITAEKTLDGEANERIFEFQLFDSEGNVLQTKNNVMGDVTFDTLEFAQAGVYTYTVKETHGDDAGILYDHDVYTVTITVTAPEDGSAFTADVKYTKDGEAVETILFENMTNEEKEDEDIVPAGDDSNRTLWLTVLALSAAAAIIFALSIKKKQHSF